jgi:hypothetical protein
MIFAEADPLNWNGIINTGAVGVMLVVAVGALRSVFAKLIASLEATALQSRTDLNTERSARQAHEAQMAKVMGEIVEQLKSLRCQGKTT